MYVLQPPWGPEMGMEHNKTFTILGMVMQTIEEFFLNLFSGSMEQDGLRQNIKSNTHSIYASGDVVQVISSSGSNITDYTGKHAEKLRCAVENLSKAMSKSFRDTALSKEKNSTVTGRVMVSKTYIIIHWQWIALPVVVWLLGLFTLIGVIWKTRKSIAPTWKNDVIPLLSVYESSENENTEIDGKLSDKQKVRLYESEGRIQLGI
jgi:hypothetical protein